MRDREVRFLIEGDPIAKARARMRFGFKKRVYDAQHLEKLNHQIIVRKAFDGQLQFEGPCIMIVTFCMPIKKSHMVVEGSYHSYRPDTDNLLKWVMDVCNAIAYKDDCCIAEIVAKKIYSHKPRTEIIIKELENAETEKARRTKLLRKV